MREAIRKLVHLVFGLAIAGLIITLPREFVIEILALSLLAGLILSELIRRGNPVPFISPFVKYLDREDSLPGRGALYFTASALFCLIIFPVPVVAPAIVALSILDSVAAISGRRFGKTRIWNNKTLEGTVFGIIGTFFPLLLMVSPAGAGTISVVAGTLELISPVDDNLTIPVGICVLLTLFPFLI
jgi:phytol kinase